MLHHDARHLLHRAVSDEEQPPCAERRAEALAVKRRDLAVRWLPLEMVDEPAARAGGATGVRERPCLAGDYGLTSVREGRMRGAIRAAVVRCRHETVAVLETAWWVLSRQCRVRGQRHPRPLHVLRMGADGLRLLQVELGKRESPNQQEGHGCNAAVVHAIALATYSLFARCLARCFGTNLAVLKPHWVALATPHDRRCP